LPILLLNSCVSLTGFQDAKVLNKNQGEASLSINRSTTPDFDNDTLEIAYPNIELGARYGISSKIDVGIRINSNINIAIDGKYQFVGDKSSTFAMAGGLQLGSFGLGSNLLNFQVPLYLSVHPTKELSIYLSPRHVWQFAIGLSSNSFRYYGGNFGILYGKKHKIGIEYGIFRTERIGIDALSKSTGSIGTFGISGKFVFGGENEDSVDEFIEKKSKKKKSKRKS
jgi:hypothetical protein